MPKCGIAVKMKFQSLLVSISLHLIYECFVDKRIGITGIEHYSRAQKGLHIVGELCIYHLLLYIIDILLIGWCLATLKLHVFPIA